ncbi:phage holin family protein [Roseococcus sp. YIM B11640]|uniref:phage holin family protein n=1 Tax=Roseococcus sp. YIM B11640 TaxID=3133973 RepID=UPI003C7AB8B7
MRSLQLLGVAAEAETLRLKREAGAMASRVVLMGIAGVFAVIALGFLHAAAWIALARWQGPLSATLYLGLADLVAAGILLFLARARPDPVAQEAKLLRQRSLAQLSQLSPVGEAVSLLGRRGPAYEVGGIIGEQILRIFTKRQG